MSLQASARRLVALSDLLFHAIEAALVAVLAALVALVFVNVVLRYAFDSGILVTDEVSRMMFVWISFVGAVSVSRRNQHLGVDLVTAALPAAGRRAARIVSDLGILGCCVLLGTGALDQAVANWINAAPISGLPTGLTYAAPLVASVLIGLVALADIIGALIGIGPADSHDPEGEVAP